MISGQKEEPSREVRVYMKGGLGNQLFSLAAAIEVAENTNSKVVVSTALLQKRPIHGDSFSRWDLQLGQLEGELFAIDSSRFQSEQGSSWDSKVLSLMELLTMKAPKISSKLGLISRINFQQNMRVAISPMGTRVLGLFLDPNLALNASISLKSHFQNLSDPSETYIFLREEISRVQPKVIHYRSGDYENMRDLYGSLSKKYFREAADRLGPQAEYWLFTNHEDADLFASNLPMNISRVIDHKQLMTPLETMHLLGMGSGFVGSNSSFSFWAALLGREGIPKIFPNSLDAKHRIAQLIPEDWNWQIIDSVED